LICGVPECPYKGAEVIFLRQTKKIITSVEDKSLQILNVDFGGHYITKDLNW